MAAQVTNYQCPSCTGPLHFVGASGKLECDYCGATYDVAEIEALYAEKEEKAAAAQFRQPLCSRRFPCSSRRPSLPLRQRPVRGPAPPAADRMTENSASTAARPEDKGNRSE